MRKPIAILVGIAILLTAAVAWAVTVPEKVTIKAAVSKQGPVTFDHAKHATKLVKTCDVCHHEQKGLTKDTKAEVKACNACHLDIKGKVMPSSREMSMTKNPFHIRCAGCHKTEKKGPVVCTGCHAKKA